MKKIIVGIIALMLLLSLCACGSGGGNAGGNAGGDVKGEIFDAGNVSALVPKGWKAFPVEDTFDDYDGDVNPYKIYIYKGADTELDMFSTPGVTIVSYDPNTTVSVEATKMFADDVQDLEPMTCGDWTYEGFSATSMDYPVVSLFSLDNEDGAQIQVNFIMENDGNSISLDDPDVQAILASIAVVNE